MTEQEELQYLLANSPKALPDDPSSSGWSTSQIKEKHYKGLVILYNWIKAIRTAYIQTENIVNALNDNSTDKPLSANMGKTLKELIDSNKDSLDADISRIDGLLASNDTSLDTIQKIVNFIKNNKSLIDSLSSGKINFSAIVDDLLSTDSTKVLSAKQGKVLKDLLDAEISNRQTAVANEILARQNADELLQNNINAEIGKLTNGTTIVDKAYKDHNGNNIDSTYVKIANIINALNDTSTNKPLSAAQGKALKDMIDAINTLLASDTTTLDTLQEVVNYIKNNKSLIDGITISKMAFTDLVKNLTTNNDNLPLAASQGYALKAMIDAINDVEDGIQAAEALRVLAEEGRVAAEELRVETFAGFESTINGKQDALTFDDTPTANSTNPVKSGGVKTYVDSGLSTKQNTLTEGTGIDITSDTISVDTSVIATKSYSDSNLDKAKKYADKVANDVRYELGGYTPSVDTDSTASYTKTAPANAKGIKIISVSGLCEKIAPSTASDDTLTALKAIPTNTYTTQVDYVGGYTEPSENLAVFDDVAETTINGVKVKYEDGAVYLDGTANAQFKVIVQLKQPIYANQDYYVKLFTSGTTTATNPKAIGETSTDANLLIPSTTTFNVAYNINYFWFSVGNATVWTNYVVKPMIVKGTTEPTNWKEGFTDLRSAKTTSIVASGSNLANNPTITNNVSSDYNPLIVVSNLNLEANKTYTISFKNENTLASGTRYYITGDNNSINYTYTGANSSKTEYSITFTPSQNENTIKIRLQYTSSGDTGTTTNVMLNKDSTVLDYVPYTQPITKQIPSAILNNEYYGLGYDSTRYNKLDLINRNLIVEYKMLLAKNITWLGVNGFFQANVGAKATSNQTSARIISTNYATDSADHIYNGTNDKRIGANADNGYLQVRDNDYTDATAFKNHFSDTDSVLIELRSQTIFDMSSYLDNSFKTFTTNNNYTHIEFVNEYGYDMPNKVEYYGTIKEGLCSSIDIAGETVALTNNDTKYGWGISSSCCNTRNYDDNKGTPNVDRVDLGSLNGWIYDGSSFKVDIPSIKKASGFYAVGNLVTAIYTTVSFANLSSTDKGICVIDAAAQIRVHDNTYTDAATFKTAMSGVYLYYEKSSVTEEDITPIEQYHNVEEDDVVTFTNPNQVDIPSTVTYLIEEERV